MAETSQPTELDQGISIARALNETHGDRIDITSRTRAVGDQIRNQITAEAGKVNSHINKASQYAIAKIAKSSGKVQANIDEAIMDSGNLIRQTISGAASHLIDLGIDLPSDRQIQEMKRQLVVAQAATIPKPGPPTQQPIATCLVHKLPMEVRFIYRKLIGVGISTYFVVPVNSTPADYPAVANYSRIFPNWWNAELACRLMTDCKFTFAHVFPYFPVIDNVQLASGPMLDWMKPLCDNFFMMADAYLAAQNQPPPLTNNSAAPESVLPEGYCWYCDNDGGKHIYPCTPETLPDGWTRC
jgi:hypothetical protein